MTSILDAIVALDWSVTRWTVLRWLSLLIAFATIPSVLVHRRGRPTAALAWILGIVALPYVGLLMWWLIGRTYIERQRRRFRARRRRADAGFEAGFEPRDTLIAIERLPREEAASVYPPTAGNRARILVDAAQVYAAMERMIREATRSIDMLMYIVNDDATGARFRDLLAQKAREGVRVRFLGDGVGSPAAGGEFFRPLAEAGGRVENFLPLTFTRRLHTMNFRNHRKILVADGRVAYTGGVNVGDEHLSGWHDFGLALEGPVVEHLSDVFADDWFFATGENAGDEPPAGSGASFFDAERGGLPDDERAECTVVASGPDSNFNALYDMFFVALTTAKRRVWLTTPYFIPDSAVQAALRTAVYRGVDVRLMTPKKSDLPATRYAQRSYYEALITAGVGIYEYEPAVMHGKMWIVDDDLTVIGSANVDTRSFRLNFESSCFVRSKSVNARAASIFEADMRVSDEITLGEVRARGRGQAILEALAQLFSPLL
ncbi:cardiolipin synthase [bacterium]|nr:cardiolipin synthase [bacterium]